MRFRLFIFYISLCGILCAQNTSATPPRLVVGIKIDGLQQSHLNKLENYLSSNGLKRFISEGAVVENMRHNILSAGSAADVATMFSGTVPYYHGVSGNDYFDRSLREIVSILRDENQVGIGTKQKLSAHNLLTSTLVDELVMVSPQSKTYSIAIQPEDAIMMGGHTADYVCWIDPSQLKWVTTAYYTKGLTRWADEMNASGKFQEIASKSWRPNISMSNYLNPSASGSRTAEFQYNPLERKKANSAETILCNTPAANNLVSELAQTVFNREGLGEDKFTDMLLLQFTVKTPKETTSALQTAEKEDMYFRLDKEIQNLISYITSKTGTENVLFYLVGSPGDLHSPLELGSNKIPAGYFNADRSIALINTYLMALYGQEKWMEGYYGKNLFLNRRRIEEKKLNFQEIQNRVAEFLLEFEGIQAAFPVNQIINYNGNDADERLKLRNSYHKKTSGDIVITLLPGWVEVNDKNQVVGEANTPVTYVPFYLYGWKIKHKVINTACQTVDITPTLCRILNISYPNACIGKPIGELIGE